MQWARASSSGNRLFSVQFRPQIVLSTESQWRGDYDEVELQNSLGLSEFSCFDAGSFSRSSVRSGLLDHEGSDAYRTL